MNCSLLKVFLRYSFRGIIILLVFFNLSQTWAETKSREGQNEILAIGTGLVRDGNVARAKNVALEQALLRGVEIYLARHLGSKGMMNNFTRIVHQILPRAKDQIENFNILAEERVNKYYKILVRLKVNENMVEELFREIGVGTSEGSAVRMLFLVSQDLHQEGGVSYWWGDPEKGRSLTHTEIALYREFQLRGGQPINRTQTPAEGHSSDDMRVPDIEGPMAARWGELYSADVVVMGKSEILEGGLVAVSLKALDVETGRTVVQGRETERIIDDQEGENPVLAALEKVINRIATVVVPEIMAAIQTAQKAKTMMVVTLQGLSSYKQFREFEVFLKKEIRGVKSVKKKRIKGNSITIAVEYSGEQDQFLENVLSHENFPFLADVEKSDEGEIMMQIR